MQRLYLGHVGNTRAYLVRGQSIEQLTVVHNVAARVRAAGSLTREEADRYHIRDVLYRYLGEPLTSFEGPDIREVLLQAGDRLLLCTDGLSGVVSDEQLRSFSKNKAAVEECATGLCQFALNQGSRDNVSCVVIEAVEVK
jgi:protein phosphatase